MLGVSSPKDPLLFAGDRTSCCSLLAKLFGCSLPTVATFLILRMPLRPWLLQQEWTEIPRDRLERTFHTNIIAMMSLAQKAVKHMPKGGSIINISSVQAYGEQGSGMPGMVCGSLLQELQQGVSRLCASGLCICMLVSCGWTSLQSHRCRALWIDRPVAGHFAQAKWATLLLPFGEHTEPSCCLARMLPQPALPSSSM